MREKYKAPECFVLTLETENILVQSGDNTVNVEELLKKKN